MFEITWENLLGEKILIDNNESNSITCPLDCISVLIILNKESYTFSNSKVFLRKEETALALRLMGTT
jgi:hypothetical protein